MHRIPLDVAVQTSSRNAHDRHSVLIDAAVDAKGLDHLKISQEASDHPPCLRAPGPSGKTAMLKGNVPSVKLPDLHENGLTRCFLGQSLPKKRHKTHLVALSWRYALTSGLLLTDLCSYRQYVFASLCSLLLNE